MRRAILILTLLAAALWSAPSLAQSRSQLGPLCTTDTTPADQQIDACNKIVALKVFSGEKLATIYFWRAVGWNKKGDYTQVIADATEAIRLHPSVALYNLRGSAYYDKGEDDIAIADFNDALRIGPPSGIIFHNRGNAWRSKGEYAQAIADYDRSDPARPPIEPFPGRTAALRNARSAISTARSPTSTKRSGSTRRCPQPLISRAVIWRAKGDLDRAIADATEAIRLAKAKAPVNIMTPPGSVLISAYTQRALAYEAKGDLDRAKQDYAAALEGEAVRRRQQGQPGHREGSPVAAVRDATALAANGTRGATAAASRPRRLRRRAQRARPRLRSGAAPARRTGRDAGRRVALVIGNGAYARVKALPNPPNDARSIAKSLRDIGFVVSEGIDLDRAAMQKTTRDFLREAARAQVAVVYYAGHGVQIDGRNYLVPVDVAGCRPAAA